MKKLHAIVLAPLLGVALLAASPDCKNPQTQTDMNICAAQQLQASERTMRHVYEQLLAAATPTAGAVAKIRAAQAAWVRYRDAMTEAAFPLPNKQVEYGTMYSLLYATLRTRLTDEHTKDLQYVLKTQYEPH